MANENVTVLRADGTRAEIPYPEKLAGWQKLVGGYIEVVLIEPGKCAIVNEEGLLRGLPYNVQASALARRDLVGDVVIVEGLAFARWNKED